MRSVVASLLLCTFLISTAFSTKADITDLDRIRLQSQAVGTTLVVAFSGVETQGLHIRVFDQSGNLIESKTLSGETKSLELERAKKGIYWVTVSKNHEMTYKRINFH